MTSKLYYHGTDEEVRPGDRIELKSLFLRRRRHGTVVCIPEKTALELDAERKHPDDWLIKLDDGTFTGWMYHPEELQPTPRLRLVSRDAEFEPVTNEELERQDAEIAAKSGPMDDLLGCGVVLLIAMGVILLVAVAKYGPPW